MAEYKAIRGHTIRTVAGDPDPLAVGDIWYSTVTKKIRGAAIGAGSWSTGGALNSGRRGLAGCGAASTSALAFGGELPAATDISEEYNGTSWTEGDDLNHARIRLGGCGTQTAGLASASETAPGIETEIYDGSSWTEEGDLNGARGYVMTFGTSTAAVTAGGTPPALALVEEWNGTSWTEVTNIPAVKYGAGTAGILTNGLIFGGQPAPHVSTIQYDGTSWTAGGNVSTGRLATVGFGETQDTAISVSGATAPGPVPTVCEEYNGSSWTEVADISTGRHASAAAGVRATGALFGGAGQANEPGTYDLCEEWDKGASANSFTSS